MLLRALLLPAILGLVSLTLASRHPPETDTTHPDQLPFYGPLTPRDVLGPEPPPLSSAIHPSALAAYKAHMAALPVDRAYTIVRYDPATDMVVIETVDFATEALLDERAFAAGESAAEWHAAEAAYNERHEDWLFGKTREEIEPVFGWPGELTEEEMQEDLRESIAKRGSGGDEL